MRAVGAYLAAAFARRMRDQYARANAEHEANSVRAITHGERVIRGVRPHTIVIDDIPRDVDLIRQPDGTYAMPQLVEHFK